MLSALSIIPQASQQYTQEPNSFNVSASWTYRGVGHIDEAGKWVNS